MIELWNNITTSEITFIVMAVLLVSLIATLVRANISVVETVHKLAMEWKELHDKYQEEQRYSKYLYMVIKRYEQECDIPLEAVSQMLIDDTNVKL